MHTRIKTGVATLIQFVFGTILTFATGISAIIAGCRHGGSDCVGNAFVSLLLIILTIAAYGVLLGVGFVAQDRRSSRLALILIALEFIGMVVFLFDARHATGIVDRGANFIAFLIAAWVIFIAFRQFRAGGARLVRRRSTH